MHLSILTILQKMSAYSSINSDVIALTLAEWKCFFTVAASSRIKGVRSDRSLAAGLLYLSV